MVERTLTASRTTGLRTNWTVPLAAGIFAGATAFDAAPASLSVLGAGSALWAAAGLGLMLFLRRAAAWKGLRWAAWSASAGVWLHSLLEGIAAGAASSLAWGSAALLVLSLVVHLIPESLALFTVLTESGMDAGRALGRCAVTWGLVAAGFLGAEVLMAGAAPEATGALMGVAAGMFAFLAWTIWQQRTTRTATAWLGVAAGVAWVALLHL